MLHVVGLFSKMGIDLLLFYRMENYGIIEQIHELLQDKIRKKK